MIMLMFVINNCFLLSTFMCSWFRSLFAKYTTLFVAMKGRNKSLPISFLFRNGADIVAYLSMGIHKISNTRRISHCV
jgi:hypothetical protein